MTQRPMCRPSTKSPDLHLVHSFLPRHELFARPRVPVGLVRGAQVSTGEKCSVLDRRRHTPGRNADISVAPASTRRARPARGCPVSAPGAFRGFLAMTASNFRRRRSNQWPFVGAAASERGKDQPRRDGSPSASGDLCRQMLNRPPPAERGCQHGRRTRSPVDHRRLIPGWPDGCRRWSRRSHAAPWQSQGESRRRLGAREMVGS